MMYDWHFTIYYLMSACLRACLSACLPTCLSACLAACLQVMIVFSTRCITPPPPPPPLSERVLNVVKPSFYKSKQFFLYRVVWYRVVYGGMMYEWHFTHDYSMYAWLPACLPTRLSLIHDNFFSNFYLLRFDTLQYTTVTTIVRASVSINKTSSKTVLEIFSRRLYRLVQKRCEPG